jgi:hypothetical protein
MEHDDFLQAALEGRRTAAAIFCIRHRESGRRLICATTTLSKRVSEYATDLRKGTCHNAALAADLVKDGPDAFVVELLQVVDRPCDLRPIKKLYVVEDQRLGRSYHAPEPESRGRLLVPESVDQPGSSLASAIERLKLLRLPGHDVAT